MNQTSSSLYFLKFYKRSCNPYRIAFKCSVFHQLKFQSPKISRTSITIKAYTDSLFYSNKRHDKPKYNHFGKSMSLAMLTTSAINPTVLVNQRQLSV